MRWRFAFERKGRSTQPRRRQMRSRLTLERLERRDVPTFLTASYYPSGGAGGSPIAFAVADFNTDGAQDLAVANANGYMDVKFNTGDGTLVHDAGYAAAGTELRSVTTGDFNNDGFPDLATASLGEGASIGRIGVFLNAGDGSLLPKQEYNAGGGLTSIATADMTGDGKLDLVVTSGTNGTVSVLRGTGTGKFRRVGTFTAGATPKSVAIGDFNADTIPDVIAANSAGSTVTVLFGTGGGPLSGPVAYQAGPNVSALTVGDFDVDGALDVAVSNANGQINVLIGRGDGTFRPPVSYGVGQEPVDLFAADFNGDSFPDLAIADRFFPKGATHVMLGVGDGTFGVPMSYGFVADAQAVNAADLSGDGISDLIVGVDHNFAVAFGAGDGTFHAGHTAPTGDETTSVATGDFNSDGLPDVVVANFSGDDLSVFLNAGGGFVQAAMNFPSDNGPRSVVTADLNADGILDLAAACDYAQTVVVLLGNGDGTFQTKISNAIGLAPEDLDISDLNSDGAPDIVAANSFSDSISVLLGNGDGTFEPAVDYAAGDNPSSVASGDFNGDSTPDIAVGNSDPSGTLWIFLGAGDGTLLSPVAYDGGKTPNDIVVADLDDDGSLDLGMSHYNAQSDDVAVVLGNGDGTFNAPAFYSTGGDPFGIAAGDFNGDDVLDLVVSNSGLSDAPAGLGLLTGIGDGTFQPAQQFVAGSQPWDVAVADFNGDGTPDVAIANHGGGPGAVTIILAADTLPAPLPSTNSRPVADHFDVDGQLDILAPNVSAATTNLLHGSGNAEQPGNPSPKPSVRVIRAVAAPGDILAGDMIMNWDI